MRMVMVVIALTPAFCKHFECQSLGVVIFRLALLRNVDGIVCNRHGGQMHETAS